MTLEYFPRAQVAGRLANGWRLIEGHVYEPGDWAILMQRPDSPAGDKPQRREGHIHRSTDQAVAEALAKAEIHETATARHRLLEFIRRQSPDGKPLRFSSADACIALNVNQVHINRLLKRLIGIGAIELVARDKSNHPPTIRLSEDVKIPTPPRPRSTKSQAAWSRGDVLQRRRWAKAERRLVAAE